MNKKITSYNTRISNDIKRFFTPTLPQLALDLIVAFLLLVLLNARSIWSYFATGAASDTKSLDLSSLIDEKFPLIQSLNDILNKGRLIQILFWLFIGCLVYILVWFIGSVLNNIRNDLVADEYVHPKTYDRSVYWGSVFTRKIIFGSLSFIFIIYIYVGLKLAALFAILCRQSIEQFQWANLLALAGALVATALLIHIGMLLLRFVINSWQLIYRDL